MYYLDLKLFFFVSIVPFGKSFTDKGNYLI